MRELLTEEQIRSRVSALGNQLTDDYANSSLTVIGVLTGSLVFLADLIRTIQLPLQLGLVQASSYRGRTTRPGKLHLGLELLPDIEGRDVLVVDDIFDTGRTLVELCGALHDRSPRSLKSVVLLAKEGCCQVNVSPDYIGFSIPDEFVVGYGLDYDGEYRHLPSISVLESSDLAGR